MVAVPNPPSNGLRITASRRLPHLMLEHSFSIAFTTYQGGKVFFLGTGETGALEAFGASFSRCTGLALTIDRNSLFMATEIQLFRFDNILAAGAKHGRHDAIFAPHQSWITGDLDVHDVGVGADGLPIFASSLFNCIGTVESGYSFKEVWKPDFISQIVPEDRCHLNGIAFENGKPRYVTSLSRTDVVEGWRDHRQDGGVVIDVESGDVVCEGLSMPHSPRLVDGRLWVLNSGKGELGWIDVSEGKFHPVAFCPGFARGLAFLGNYAIVGLSKARDESLNGLPLDKLLSERGVSARCGFLVVDVIAGHVAETARIDGEISELFDVAVLPGYRCPSIIGMSRDDVRRVVKVKQSEA